MGLWRFRIADMIGIHQVMATVFWTVSDFPWYATFIVWAATIHACWRLLQDWENKERDRHFISILRTMFAALVPMGARGEWIFVGCQALCITCGAVCYALSDTHLYGYGHGLFHFCLIPHVGIFMASGMARELSFV